MIKFRAGNKNSHSEASSAPAQEVTPAKKSVSCVINNRQHPVEHFSAMTNNFPFGKIYIIAFPLCRSFLRLLKMR